MKIGNIVLGLGFAIVSALGLAACGNAQLVTNARPGDTCSADARPRRSSACGLPCSLPGYDPGVACVGGRYVCGCYSPGEFGDTPTPTPDAGTPVGEYVLNGPCSTPNVPHVVTGGNCAGGQLYIAYCLNGRWTGGAGSCSDPQWGDRWCAPGSQTATTAHCPATCPNAGEVTIRTCGNDGLGYGVCFCGTLGGGNTGGCTPGTTQTCTFPCSGDFAGTSPGFQVCGPNRAWDSCRQAGTCTGGSNPGGCTNGQSRQCNPCTSGGSTSSGTQICSNGQWGACNLVAGQTCGGGSTGTGGACGGGYIVATARNANHRIRCWGNGVIWTSTSNEFRVNEADLSVGNQCGYTACITGTVSTGGAFIPDPWYLNNANAGRPASDMFTRFGIIGRSSDLNDVLGSTSAARDRFGSDGVKFHFPVNTNCIGRNGDC